jgi:hypothetical protein
MMGSLVLFQPHPWVAALLPSGGDTVDISAATATLGVILAFFAPFITAVINRPSTASWVKQLIALAVAVAMAAIALAVTGGFNHQGVYTVFLAMIGVSQAAYTLIWKPSGAAPKIEAAIPPKGNPTPPPQVS